MRLDAPPPFALVLGTAAWQRCAFEDAALVDGLVQLGWDMAAGGGAAAGPVADPLGAGLAFDAHCRLWHSLPAAGQVERWLWPLVPPVAGAAPDRSEPWPVLAGTPAAPGVVGSLPVEAPGSAFAPRPAAAGAAPAFVPRALACDGDRHLFVLDAAGGRVCVIDTVDRVVRRSLAVPAGAADLALHDGWIWGLSGGAVPSLWRLAAHADVQAVASPVGGCAGAARIAFAAEDGELFVLGGVHEAGAQLWRLGAPGAWRAAPQALVLPAGAVAHASDIACTPGHLVVARRPGEDFQRVALSTEPPALAEPLTARRYDGMGIAAAPDDRIAFHTPKGPRLAGSAQLRYRPRARVVTMRLDSGRYQTTWGRMLLDACVPPQTQLELQAVASDDDEPGARAVRTPPANAAALAAVADEAETPLPPLAALASLASSGAPTRATPPCHARSDGSEQAWYVEADGFGTFEAAAPAAPGRYLWLVITLRGTARATPKLRGVRAELPAHDWLRRLPALYSRPDDMRRFLQRFLSPLAGLHRDLAAQAVNRHALLEPMSTPQAVLPWLAGWLGLPLDERWSEPARREFIREAAWLFRLRGTPWALARMLEIVARAPVVLVEQFRLRGLGRLGDDAGAPGWDEPAVLGFGLRVGGPIGQAEAREREPGSADDSFARHAHRFVVLVRAELTAAQEDVLRHLLDVHRPAHTLYTLCSVGAGMRIGRGLLLELTSVLGESGGFRQSPLGHALLGRGEVLGRAAPGLRAGAPSAALGTPASRMG